jgi:hypothetical protein
MKKSKRILFSLITLLFSAAAALLLAEALVRVFRLAPPLSLQYSNNIKDPYLPFKPRPLSVLSGRSPTGEFAYEYRHNRFGLRDVEHSQRKDARCFRILGLGDSFTYGAGVRFEETYLFRLERMLNERPGNHPRVEVIKAGISMYFPEPERILLERYGKTYRPDLVLVGFLPNDVIDTQRGLGEIRVDESGYLKTREADALGSWGVALYLNSHLFRFLQKSLRDTLARGDAPVVRESDWLKQDGIYERHWRTIESEYSRMAEISRSLPGSLVLIHIPQNGPWSEIHSYPATRLSAWAAANGAGFVDTLPAMSQAAKSQTLYYEHDGHCTAEGHLLIAQEIFAYLTAQALVP